MMILVKDAGASAGDDDKNSHWDVAYSKVTTNLVEKAFSSRLNTMPLYDSGGGTIAPSLTSGDIVRIEIYPMIASSGTIDTVNNTGALYMDAVNLIVP